MTSLIIQRRAAIPQLKASLEGQPRQPWVQSLPLGREMGVVRKQKVIPIKHTKEKRVNAGIRL